VLSHPGRVAEGEVAVVCNGWGFGVLVEMLGGKVKVHGSIHLGGNILAEGIQCARIKILELLRLVASMIILEVYDLLQVHTSPYIVPPLLSIPKLAVCPLPLLWHGCCHKTHCGKFHLGSFLNFILNLVANYAS
jgi:hypothetical protein